MAPFVVALLVAALGPAPADTSSTAPPRPATGDDHRTRDPFAVPTREPSAAATEAGPATPTPAATPARRPTPAIVRAELRDPFVDGGRSSSGRPISADLKDPFAVPARGVPLTPIRDLRDPFVPRPDGLRPGVCVTPAGVPVQRPKSLRVAPSTRCPGHDAPLRNPFALPA